MTPPTQPQDKLFFALLPDPDTATLVADLAKEWQWNFDLSGAATPVDRLHVSLISLGRFDGLPGDIIAAAARAAAAIQAVPFEITFDQRLSFKGVPHPLVLTCRQPAPALAELRQTLGTALKQSGLATAHEPAGFVPHLTVLRDPKPLPPAAIDPISWLVQDFVLIHSIHGRGHHEPLGRWPLRSSFTLSAR